MALQFSTRFIAATKEYTTVEKAVPSPYLRRSFTLSAQPEAAAVRVCGLGFYELYVNGQRITKCLLAPYISNPDDILYYDDYDLAPYLQAGENVIGLQLGNGFLNCWGGFVWDFEKSRFRSAPKAALYLEYTVNGETAAFEADEQFVCAASPITCDDLRIGEEYDARLEIAGWSEPGFDASAWTPAMAAETPRGECRICEADPVVPHGEMQPVRIWAEGDDYIYDFGQNHAGLTRLTVQGKPGQTITLLHGEYLPDGKFNADNLIFLRPEYVDMPQYTQRTVYTCKGEGVETYMPRFTYYGFRYVKVSGITAEQATPDLLTYVVHHSDLAERGSFTCSDELLNQLQKMVRISTLSNFVWFPTDCPHREKNGWTADASLSTEHTLLNLQPERSYREWLHNIRAAMDERGALPGIIPTSGWGFAWGNGPAWDHILTNLPYMTYIYRGDKTILAENATAIFQYVSYLTTRTREDGLIAIGLGDWVAPHGKPKSALDFTDTICSIDICQKAAYIFGELGQTARRDFALRVAADFKAALRRERIDFNTMTAAGCCQTSQALALYYNIFEPGERKAAFEVLLRLIHEQDDHIDTGVLGLRIIFETLSRFGHGDLAYKMITQPDAPSYGQMIASGETTICESFAGYDHCGSHNHHFLGDISNWFIQCVGGIRLNPQRRDVNEVWIQPDFLSALDFAKATHIAPAGEIAVEWKRDGDAIVLSATVPEGMHGRVLLPQGWQAEITAPFGNRKLYRSELPLQSGECRCVPTPAISKLMQ